MPFVGTDPNDPTRVAAAPRPGPLAQAAAPAPVQPPPNPYDFSSDPLYQRIMALGEQRTEQANAAALSARTQDVIDYGDPDLARSLGLGDAAATAAARNPFSVLAGLARNEKAAPAALDESLNKQNLFYSGARGKQQSDLAMSLGQNRYNAWQANTGRLTGITNTLTGSLNAIADQESQAAQDAATRRQQQLGDLPVGPTAANPLRAGVVPAGPPLSQASPVATALRRAAMPRLPRGVRR
jgi:hypothetical protein